MARCWRRSGPGQVLAKMRALDAQKEFAGVPLARVEDLEHADAIVFGTPTRLGNMCGPMRQFLAATSQVWVSGALVGKIRSVFTSSNTQHGGQESTLLTVHTTLPHQGMVVVGLPYSFEGQMRMDEISGCSTYGASTIAGARFQRRHLASLAARLAAR